MRRAVAVTSALVFAGAGTAVGFAATASATVDTTYYVVQETVEVPANGGSGFGYANINANCNDGDTATGGGVSSVNNGTGDSFSAGVPRVVGSSVTATGWSGEFWNATNVARNASTYVVCKDT